jgi:NitT/TauT family transport system permease protein
MTRAAEAPRGATPTEASALLAERATEKKRNWLHRLGILLIGLVGLGIWEVLPRLGIVSEIVLPPFSEVATALWSLIQQEFFLTHLRVTMQEILAGFVLGTLIGFLLGAALAVWPLMKRLTYPYVVAFQAVPKVVFAPLFVAWFGFGQTSKIVMATVISFFPVLINTMVGLISVPADGVRLMRSLRATRTQTFWKLSLPHALPIISAGVKTALTFAVIGAIVGEFVGASEGLGYLLNLYNFQFRIDRVFAVIIVLSAIGTLLYLILEVIDRKLIFWREDET